MTVSCSWFPLNIPHKLVCNRGVPCWLSGKESTCQCRRPGFDTWVGKIPWRRKWQLTAVFLPRESLGQIFPLGNDCAFTSILYDGNKCPWIMPDLSLKESLIKGQVFWFYQLPIPQCQERLFLSVVSHLRKSTQIGNLLKSHLSNKECKWENFQALFLWSLYIIKILGVGDHLKHYVIIKLGRQTSNRHGPDSFGKLSHQKLSASVPGILLSDH